MRGLGIDAIGLAALAHMPQSRIGQVLCANPDETALKSAAAALHLGPERLLRLARQHYKPEVNPNTPGFAMFSNPHEEGVVNFYMFWDPTTLDAVVFDAGYDVTDLLGLAREKKLKIRMLLITHAHGDHVFDSERLMERTKATAHYGAGESFRLGEAFQAGKTFECGRLKISTRATTGHSAGGISYVVEGLDTTFVVVGDALFAGSMGGPLISYKDSLETNRAALFTLADSTIVCPGHGPLTTIGLEKRNNPFFPEFSAEEL
jgi:glyoxylase-like metal-dependent hydrolase (beta-lactamase superfamily II)